MEAVNSDKKYLDASTILALDDLGSEDVWVEKWATHVRVRGMTAGERTEYSLLMADGKIPKDAQARMVQMCALNESGHHLFLPEHVKQLSQKSAEALEPLSEAIMKLSGMGPAEEAEKN
jgi:hypothetical protein